MCIIHVADNWAKINVHINRIRLNVVYNNVAAPDPYVFGPTGFGSINQRYGSGSFSSSSKNSKKNLDSYCFVTSFDFLSLKNDVNVPSKCNKQKNIFLN